MLCKSKPYKSRTSGFVGAFLRSVCALKDMRGTYAGYVVVDLMRR